MTQSTTPQYIPLPRQITMPDEIYYAAPITAGSSMGDFMPYDWQQNAMLSNNYMDTNSMGQMQFEGSPWNQYNSGLGLDANGMSTAPNAPQGMSNFSKGIAGLQTLSSALSAFNGYKQNKLAKQQLAFQKDAFNKQYAAQRGLTNSQLQDRETRRYNEAIAQGYTPRNTVAEYMDKYGIK